MESKLSILKCIGKIAVQFEIIQGKWNNTVDKRKSIEITWNNVAAKWII